VIVHHLRATAVKCRLPRTPVGPCQPELAKGPNRHWTVAFDPDGTFAAENRLGRQDIYFGLINWNFVPGTVLENISGEDPGLPPSWLVEERINYHGKLILDARALGENEQWMRKEMFHDR